MYNGTFQIALDGLGWESDWNGDEVGFPGSEVVGLYSKSIDGDHVMNFYIDMETKEILNFWIDCEYEE